jgi:histidine triad (HIT) family protein
MNCVFCDIVNGKEKAEILFEDENTLSFLDIRPFNYGHSLIVPKKHYDNFLEIPTDELKSVINTTQIISAAVTKSLKPEGFNILANNGSAAGQTIFHFHFHIIPRFRDDDFKFRVNLKQYTDGMMKNFADQIRDKIIK